MSVNPVNSNYAQPNSFVLCSKQGSFQASSGKMNNVPSGERANIKAAQRKFVQSTISPQTEKDQTSFFDQALNVVANLFRSQRQSNPKSNPEFALV